MYLQLTLMLMLKTVVAVEVPVAVEAPPAATLPASDKARSVRALSRLEIDTCRPPCILMIHARWTEI